jgi:hypothetical protein
MDIKFTQTNRNAMEVLIGEEIEQQLIVYPKKLANYINKLEVAAYALNRLPPLYASSEEGFEKQKKRGRKEFAEQITIAVRQGLAAVQRDPIRTSTPLLSDEDYEYKELKLALQELADLVPQRDITWLVRFVKKVLTKIIDRELTQEEVDNLSYQLYYDWNKYSK